MSCTVEGFPESETPGGCTCKLAQPWIPIATQTLLAEDVSAIPQRPIFL